MASDKRKQTTGTGSGDGSKGAPSSDDESSTNTRSRRDRKLSAAGMESLISEADLAQLDGSRVNTHSSSSSSASSAPSSLSYSDDEKDVIARFIAHLRGERKKGSDKSRKQHASSVSTPPSMPQVAAKTDSSDNGSGISGIATGTQRLITGMSTITGVSTIAPPHSGAVAITPDTVARPDSSDSESDGDDGTRRITRTLPSHVAVSADDLVWRHIHVRAKKRVALHADTMTQLHYGSSVRRVADNNVRCRELRNRFEADSLAVIIDAARDGRCDVVMELAYRRLLGVEAADKANSWTVATVMDVSRPSSLLSVDAQRELDRSVQRYKAANTGSNSSNKPSRTEPGTGGQWHKGKVKRRSGNGNKNGGNGNKEGGGAGGATAKS